MKAKYLVILIVLMQINCVNAQVSYNYKLYTTEDGLISNTCYKIFQDSKGYLWIANGNGVSKFNGKSFDNTIDKSYLKYWAVEDFIENKTSSLIINNPDFVFDTYSKKYLWRDSALTQYYINGRKDWGVRAAKTYLDKDFYKIYSLNKLSIHTHDTLYYSFNGKYKYVICPINKKNSELELLKDRSNNVYVGVFDSLSKNYKYYSFDKGVLKFLVQAKEKLIRIEKDYKNNLITFCNIYNASKTKTKVSILSDKFVELDYFIFETLHQWHDDFDCVFDLEKSVWFSSNKGIIKYNEKTGFKEYIDRDRNIDTTLTQEFDAMGSSYTVKYVVDGNYNSLAIDRNGNMINGDRIFDGENFADILPFSLYPEFKFNNLEVINKKLTGIEDLIYDRESNIWMATQNGLIKFTPVPYRKSQSYLSKNEPDYKLEYVDGFERKFYIKNDDLKRQFHLKIYKDSSLLFYKTYKKPSFSLTGKGIDEVLAFYPFGKNAAMFFNSESYKYALCLFSNKEIKKYEFKDYIFKLYSDSVNMIFQGWQTPLFVVNQDKVSEIKIDNSVSEKLIFSKLNNNGQCYNFFNKENKILGKNLTIFKLNSKFKFDTISYGNLELKTRYNISGLFKLYFGNYNLLAIDKRCNFYFLNENSHVKYELTKKSDSSHISFDIADFNKVLVFKDLLLLTKHNRLVVFKIDTLSHLLQLQNDFTFKNGLLSMYENAFFIHNDYLIINSQGIPYISVFKYADFIKNGLNNPLNIKVPEWEDNLVTSSINSFKNILRDSFFNNQPPLININSIVYSINGIQIIDSIRSNHSFSSSTSNLTFNYDAVSLTEGDYIHTKYNVLGFDTTWQTINTNDIVFSSLPPGSYTLQIKACNNHNFWSEPKQLAFTIEYPWYRTWVAYILYVILGGGAIYLFIKSRTKKLEEEKNNLEKIIEERTAEVVEEKKVITEQKHLIEEKHKEITDSINYAERIQRSFLATKEQLDEQLKDYFVFFQPKDVVSGDFYWAHTLQNRNFALVTADSTGHGVPGAIMSLLNTSSLEKAVELGINEPAEILNHTRQTIIERLKKDGSAEGGKDGMDCSLISFNKEKTKLVYAAANNPIWIIRNNELIELSPDKIPVGKHDRDSITFTQHEVDLQKGDMIYTLTDGFPDQFGGPKGKKFMYKKLKEVLIAIAHKPTEEQQTVLKDTLKDWMGNTEQVDDVTIIGVRV